MSYELKHTIEGKGINSKFTLFITVYNVINNFAFSNLFFIFTRIFTC